MAVAARKKFTPSDFLRAPDDGNRHEVIDGDWIMTPPPSLNHQIVQSQLHLLLGNHVQAHGLGLVLTAPIGVVLSKHDAVQPDLIFVSKSRNAILKPQGVKGAPDLVVEILSPSTQNLDRTRKHDLYEKARVREYWIIDPFTRMLEIHEFGRSKRMSVFQSGQTFTSSAVARLSIKVDDLFRSVR